MDDILLGGETPLDSEAQTIWDSDDYIRFIIDVGYVPALEGN